MSRAKSTLRRRPAAAFLLTLPMFCGGLPAAADELADEPPAVLDEVTILGDPASIADIPGSADFIGPEELDVFGYSDVLDVLRNVPGIYIQEEEGYGLRPNIGIRGSGLDRSARIALLEDGVLIAPAPYAAPAAYYFPSQRRMYALEVLKGPSSIAVGPRTTGGAINLISTPIPTERGGGFDLRAGEDATVEAVARYGASGEHVGWLLETVQQRTDGFKDIDAPGDFDSGYRLDDYLGKLRFSTGDAAALYQSVELKLGYTDQASDETYLGLTDADFEADPYRRYAASQGDVFNSTHRQYQGTWRIESERGWNADLTAYRNEFQRNWFKLRSVNGTGISSILADPGTFASELAVIRGATSADDALLKRNNNRSYYSRGLQARAGYSLFTGPADVDFSFGLRVHEDEEDRFQDQDRFRMEDGLLVLTTDGAPGSTTNRVSRADVRSTFFNAEITAGAWTFTPGLRYEDIDLERLDFATDDPGRTAGPSRVRDNDVSEVIGGVGALYRLNDRWRLLAGIHEGFNPPAPGSSSDAEESLNYEAGFRYLSGPLSVEAIGFFNDYDNLIGTVTASTGGGGEIGDQFDGGEVTVSGLELDAAYRLRDLGGSGLEMPLSLTYTWTAEAEFESSFSSGFDPWGEVEAGDELPYIPEHQLQLRAGLASQRWAVNLAAIYVDETRTEAGRGSIDPRLATDDFVTFNLAADWYLTQRLRTYLRVENLFDEEYIVARRPAGARPGLPRTALLGVNFSL